MAEPAGSPLDPETRAAKHALVAEHLEGPVAAEPWVQAVEHDPSVPRWYVRFGTDGRDAATIVFDLHQRTLRHELYFLPDPPHRRNEVHELLLRANHGLYGTRFAIGPDGDCYLVGRTLLEHLDVTELDRLIGVLYEAVDRWFPPAVGLGFRRPEST